jgi:hypothetical protein
LIAKSDLGVGSTFTLRLALENDHASQRPTPR